jgi:tetratricopeptide (TPR) repeat protein
VEIAGCKEAGPAGCVASAGTELHLWVAGEGASIAVTAGGPELPLKTKEWPDGKTFTLALPEGVRWLDVRSLAATPAAPFRVAIVPEEPPLAEVARARALRQEGHLDEAAAVLQSLLADADASARRSEVMALLARVELARGNLEVGLRGLREAMLLEATEGRDSLAAHDAFALTYNLLERRRYAEVRPVLDQARPLARRSPEDRASLAYYDSLFAWRTGDIRSALRSMRAAERQAARLEDAPLHRSAVEMLAIFLQDMGRADEASDELDDLLRTDGDAMGDCERARLFSNLGFAELQAHANGQAADAGDPREPLGRALAILRGPCPDPNLASDVLENLSLAELEHPGRLAQASASLREAKSVAREPASSVALYWYHLDGRIALAQGDAARALASFAREGSFAAAFGTADDQRLATEDRAEALAARGRGDEAIRVLESAFELTEQSATFIPLGEGKDAYLGARDRGPRLHVRLLLERARDDEAMEVARRTRARLLDGVWVSTAVSHFDDARHAKWEALAGRYRALRDTIDDAASHDWSLSADHLAAAVTRRKESATIARALLDEALALLPIAPSRGGSRRAMRPGELELLYFPADDGWVGFARTEAGVLAKRLGAIDPEAPAAELSMKLLGPFGARIEKAERVRVLLYGALRAIDVHALPWREEPLLRHAVVEYALDVANTRAAPATDTPLRALVVSDPAGDLPAARAETDAVAAALASSGGWTVERLRGKDARADRVRAALERASVFDYAGHATFGGVDGLDSALTLADDGRLTPGDVLALPRVPPIVSLVGCDTGRESAHGEVDALGIANAFLAAGSRAVVATTREVGDALARDVAIELHRRLIADPALDASAALRDAQLSVRERGPTSDWSAFRALVP